MHRLLPFLLVLVWVASTGHAAAVPGEPSPAGFFYGHVSSDGLPVKGAMVTFYHGDPIHSLTVFADEQGRFLSPGLPWPDGYRVRVRRVGWKDVVLEGPKRSRQILQSGDTSSITKMYHSNEKYSMHNI